jgi:Tfp pilus assembly protein PilE
MGQQQILLVILVVIVVGIATIVATNVIYGGVVQSNRDAMRQDLMTAASSVQHIWERPTMLGGAGKDFQTDFSDERLTESIEISGNVSGTTITNENAFYTISSTDAVTVEIEAVPETGGDNMTITIQRDNQDGWIFILNDGTTTVTNQPDD